MPKDYSHLNKEELLKTVAELEDKVKHRYGLVWDEERTREKFEHDAENAYPVLREIKSRTITTDESKPVNIMIEGDNYHALSVLQYTHQAKIDVIYIDPPYNTGARDWKYNNDFVLSDDSWRHSKWLSFMKKRLLLAKNLLTENGVLIVTIDEHEVHHLGVLLEGIFPDAYRQMVTIVINPKGVTQGRFSRVEEYAIFCFLGDANISSIGDDLLTPKLEDEENGDDRPRWKGLLRSGTNARREDRKNLFYPVLVDPKRRAVIDAGDSLPLGKKPTNKKIRGLIPVWPIRTDGTLGNWGVSHGKLKELIQIGYVNLGEYDKKRKTWGISYLSKLAQEQVVGGLLEIRAFDKKRNVVDVRYTGIAQRRIKSVWHRTKHDAGAYGADHLRSILGARAFSFPKSIYAVKDALMTILQGNHNATVLDFFAGSGTTGEALLRINQEDPGNRKFIICTNNENSIATDVCFPRIEKVIKGYNKNGNGEKVDGLGGNLRYFKTSFVKQSIGRDELKIRITRECTEMLCIREGIYDEKKATGSYKIFTQGNRVMAVYYDMDLGALPKLKVELLKLKGEKVLYCFTLDPLGLDQGDFTDWTDVRLEPIPQKILDVYEEIHELHA